MTKNQNQKRFAYLKSFWSFSVPYILHTLYINVSDNNNKNPKNATLSFII